MNQHAVQRCAGPCKDCGEENYSISYCDCAEKRLIDSQGICFTCAYWRVAIAKKHDTVIAGRIYSVGTSPKGGRNNGMAGRRFDIEYLDGRTVTTYDLWAGSEVPDRYKSQVPDTARFAGGAGQVKAGDTTCWNASRG